MATILIPLATGFEEIEAVSLIDVLRRADIKVIVAALDENKSVKGAHGISIKAECSIKSISVNDIDMILLPGGGGGTTLLSEDAYTGELLRKMNKKDKLIGAICAAPYALKTAGVLSKSYTCYPSFEKKIGIEGYKPGQKVVEDGNILTSRGPGTAICFALHIVRKFVGEEKYNELKEALLVGSCE